MEGRYKAVEAADIEEGWKAIHESALVLCMHGGNCAQGSSCQVRHLRLRLPLAQCVGGITQLHTISHHCNHPSL